MTRFTRYDSVNCLLELLILELQVILKGNLTGIYLYGSLVWGDFDEQVSDIDILTVTEKFINQEEFNALHKMHEQLIRQYPKWHDRIEIAYVAKDGLITFKDKKYKIAVISPGEAFNIKEAGLDWLINYYLIQEQSMILFGPAPASMITPISQTEFISNVKDQALEWRNWIEHTKGSVGYQFYAVLTICRAMYTIHRGAQASKSVAGNWAKNEYPKWAHLIDQSLAYRTQPNTPRYDDSHFSEVRNFVFEMLETLAKQ
jgi:predicted nucleotidyltransferase